MCSTWPKGLRKFGKVHNRAGIIRGRKIRVDFVSDYKLLMVEWKMCNSSQYPPHRRTHPTSSLNSFKIQFYHPHIQPLFSFYINDVVFLARKAVPVTPITFSVRYKLLFWATCNLNSHLHLQNVVWRLYNSIWFMCRWVAGVVNDCDKLSSRGSWPQGIIFNIPPLKCVMCARNSNANFM